MQGSVAVCLTVKPPRTLPTGGRCTNQMTQIGRSLSGFQSVWYSGSCTFVSQYLKLGKELKSENHKLPSPRPYLPIFLAPVDQKHPLVLDEVSCVLLKIEFRRFDLGFYLGIQPATTPLFTKGKLPVPTTSEAGLYYNSSTQKTSTCGITKCSATIIKVALHFLKPRVLTLGLVSTTPIGVISLAAGLLMKTLPHSSFGCR